MGQWKNSVLRVNRFGWPCAYSDRPDLEGLRILRAQLQQGREDFSVGDLFDAQPRFQGEFGYREHAPVTLTSDGRLLCAALDLMREMNETVSVRKFIKEHKVLGSKKPRISLMQELAKDENAPDTIHKVFSSPYWEDHPEDMAPVWNGLPKSYRAKNPMPAFIEYADRPTLEDLRRPRGWIRKLADSETTPDHVRGLGLYKMLQDGHADYLLSRLETSHEKLTLDDYLLGSKAGIPTVLDMLIEQGHLTNIMDARNWGEGEEAVGRLMVGIIVPPDILEAQTGLKRQDLLDEFRACPWGEKLDTELQKMVRAASIRYAPAPTSAEQGNLPQMRADEPNDFSDAIDDVELPPHLVARGDQLLIEKLQRELAETKAKLAEKPATIVREMTPGERLADLHALVASPSRTVT